MSDALMAGFPPPPESVVSLGNWQEPPFNRWSFQHLREIVPTQRIARGARAKALARLRQPTGSRPYRRDAARRRSVHRRGGAGGHVDRRRHRFARRPGRPRTLLRSDAGQHASPFDVGLEVHRGMCLRNPRLSKRRLDPEAPITQYVPEIAGSGYDGATVRHLLDMRTGVAFSEAYEDPNAEVRVIERQMGWRPGRARARRPVRLSHLAVLRGAPRRPVRLSLGGHRRSRLGVRAGRRRADGRPHVHPHLGADRRRV